MIDRQAILPLALGLLVAIMGHLAVSADVARLMRAVPQPPADRPAAPDLALDAIQADRLVTVGQPVTVDAVVQNRGDAPTDAADVRWSLDGETRRSASVPSLAGGASASSSQQITFDRAGPHRVTIAVDPEEKLVDRDRSNNHRTITILAKADAPRGASPADRRPDLTPISLEPVGPLFAGQPARFQARIANVGNAPAEDVALEIMLDDLPMTTGTINKPIAPGQVALKQIKLTVDQPGPHRLCLVVDPSNLVDELDEQNNRRCARLRWRSVEARQKPGQREEPEELTVNWISYEAFREMVASHKAEQEQPLVQRSADPAPVERAPLKATPPAPQPAKARPGTPAQDATARARPARPSTPHPDQPADRAKPQPAKPETADQPDARPTDAADGESTDEPADDAQPIDAPPIDAPPADQPKRAPELPELSRADEAKAPRRNEADPPTPLEATQEPAARPWTIVQPEIDVDQPDQIAPEDAEAATRTDLTNPHLAIDTRADAGTILSSLPRLPAADEADRRAPPLDPRPQPKPAQSTREVEAPDPQEPDPAAANLPAKPDEPAAAPKPTPNAPTEDDRRTTSPDRAEQTDRESSEAEAENEASESAQPQKSAEAQPDQQPAKQTGATAGKPSNPTAAPRDTREAMPVTRIVGLEVRPGSVVARQGIRINTVSPDFSVPARLTAMPRSPIYNLRFNADGKVVDVETLRSTGYASVDSPLLIALYQWTADGEIEEDGFVIERLRIRFGSDNDDADADNAQAQNSDAP